jgi:uncharacterized protein YidB (DUF937 family)
MGLLDGILGSVLGGMQGGAQQGFPGLGQDTPQHGSGFPGGALGGVAAAAPIIMMVMQMIQKNGGLGGLLQQLQAAGHGDTAQTWVTPGQPNAPIDPSVLQQVLGQGSLAEIAQKLGMSPQQAASSMAQALPGVVDHMTPDGEVPDNHGDMVSQVLAELKAMKR